MQIGPHSKTAYRSKESRPQLGLSNADKTCSCSAQEFTARMHNRYQGLDPERCKPVLQFNELQQGDVQISCSFVFYVRLKQH